MTAQVISFSDLKKKKEEKNMERVEGIKVSKEISEWEALKMWKQAHREFNREG